jgi:hypothetical protein
MVILIQKKIILIISFIVITLQIPFNSIAQKSPSFYPFKGFHVGLTGQAEYIQKCSYISLMGTDPAPKPRWTSGWEAGIEFSYHFAKYFGISVGINFGTTLSYNIYIYSTAFPNFEGEWIEVNKYEQTLMTSMHDNELFLPIKLEFHYPLCKDLFFTAEAGVKLKGLNERLSYSKKDVGVYEIGTYLNVTPDDFDPEANAYRPKQYYHDWGYRNMSKISCNLLLGIGLYYKLPYGDLLRFTTGVNVSFNPIIEGYYKYYLTDSYGTFSVRNDFIYTQLSYIHTLGWQKAKKYVKKQENSFSTKKERRGKILELLK